jgi:hypothetical protein
VYDMYPWNQQADARDDATEAVHAVQVALDRRDNGGAAGARTAGARTAPATAGAPPRGGIQSQ